MTNTEQAIEVLESHDLLEEADRLRNAAKNCGCIDCIETGEPALKES
jgi:hypothetical protein